MAHGKPYLHTISSWNQQTTDAAERSGITPISTQQVKGSTATTRSIDPSGAGGSSDMMRSKHHSQNGCAPLSVGYRYGGSLYRASPFYRTGLHWAATKQSCRRDVHQYRARNKSYNRSPDGNASCTKEASTIRSLSLISGIRRDKPPLPTNTKRSALSLYTCSAVDSTLAATTSS